MNAKTSWLLLSILLMSSVAQGDETPSASENAKQIRAALDEIKNATQQLEAVHKRRKEAGSPLKKNESEELDVLLSKIRELQTAAIELKDGAAQPVLIQVRVLEAKGKAIAELETLLPSPTFTSEAKTLTTAETTALVERLKKTSSLTILAEPKLLVQIGVPANMRAGGEFPILIPAAEKGQTHVEWRKFGVLLQACATLGDKPEELQLDIHAEVSERDYQNATTGKEGITIPGLRTTRMNTQVVLPYGKTLVLGGLRSKEIQKDEAASKHGADSSSEKMAVFLVSLEKCNAPAE